MSMILSIETSCEHGSIALLRGDELLSRLLPVGGNTHSGALLPAIRQLLAEADASVSALDAIAFGRGPGAFTGVRLACGVAQGLALGGDLPVAAISSLEALALPFVQRAERLYCAMDARMSEIYAAMYVVASGALQAPDEVVCVPPDAAPVPDDGIWSGVGTAFSAYAPQLAERLGGRVEVLDALAVPCAGSVARLAAAAPALWRDAALAAPDYVRNRVALTTAERLAQGGKA
ncbi:tRNA (adenosine(37)-N6)-threonylcarbamoyltransferase complex dimerization subunit type 1 TsaB [Uliginosibacterium sp. H3]|uniref:tRNA (Adenosine(37)-N6)-threonylcarbamoyltransferase complex dimerization subunit type 1 TsaB n=1 Tax=Uliginosibacterium silvisoli TaxID=3114758 RepID=A0ABU6K9I8_9RHOO|nr:tRNA (adenosine(37)-N6)-threonylcarbamoyltransferase complex dimerization subunit type 1 TsaB [Uliginosibacterium sp. H3]